jgi:hypothetical protein
MRAQLLRWLAIRISIRHHKEYIQCERAHSISYDQSQLLQCIALYCDCIINLSSCRCQLQSAAKLMIHFSQLMMMRSFENTCSSYRAAAAASLSELKNVVTPTFSLPLSFLHPLPLLSLLQDDGADFCPRECELLHTLVSSLPECCLVLTRVIPSAIAMGFSQSRGVRTSLCARACFLLKKILARERSCIIASREVCQVLWLFHSASI